ncbi:RPA family protein [Haloarcula sp. H-GB5]
MMGTVTEIDQVSESPITLRAKIVDQTGSFFTYAGKYNPDEVSYLQNLEAPEHVMVVGKPNTYTTDEGDTYVSVEPENITVVEKATRDRWTAEAAVQTLDRVDAFRKGEAPYGDEADQYYDFDHEDFVKDIKEIGTEIINENTDKTDSAAQPQAPSA